MARRIQREIARESGLLDERLSEYSATARVWEGAKRLHRRTGNWPIYAAATGSALAMATGASAGSILYDIYSSPVVVHPQYGASSTAFALKGASSIKGLKMGSGPGFNLPAGKYPEVNLFAKSGTLGNGTAFAQLELQQNGPIRFFLSGPGGSAKNFGSLKTIKGTQHGTHAEVEDFFTATSFGNFKSKQPGFVGFSVATAGSGKEYGWLELEFTDKSGQPFYLEALGWGINTTPGQAITAGQTVAATPEPGTMGLAILAAGAIGVEALRRRRRAGVTS